MPSVSGGSKLTERREEVKKPDFFWQGVEQFNAERFFDAHESWEAIWVRAPEPDKTFLQGITQVSAAFHHHSKGNYAGAITLLQQGLEKLEQFPADYRGVNLAKLREEAGQWLQIIARRKAHGRQGARPKIERV